MYQRLARALVSIASLSRCIAGCLGFFTFNQFGGREPGAALTFSSADAPQLCAKSKRPRRAFVSVLLY
jgi:hypothetical protein